MNDGERVIAIANSHGIVHGNAPDGSIDVEFESLIRAVNFLNIVHHLGWKGEIRKGDSVESLNQTVVITLREINS